MARRIMLVGMLLVAAQLASGCCWKKGYLREKRAHRHASCASCDPCGCGGYPVGSSPVVVPGAHVPPTEAAPMPKKIGSISYVPPQQGPFLVGSTVR